jgi:hypothetical protein
LGREPIGEEEGCFGRKRVFIRGMLEEVSPQELE